MWKAATLKVGEVDVGAAGGGMEDRGIFYFKKWKASLKGLRRSWRSLGRSVRDASECVEECALDEESGRGKEERGLRNGSSLT